MGGGDWGDNCIFVNERSGDFDMIVEMLVEYNNFFLFLFIWEFFVFFLFDEKWVLFV